jgi:hypothetical protein
MCGEAQNCNEAFKDVGGNMCSHLCFMCGAALSCDEAFEDVRGKYEEESDATDDKE